MYAGTILPQLFLSLSVFLDITAHGSPDTIVGEHHRCIESRWLKSIENSFIIGEALAVMPGTRIRLRCTRFPLVDNPDLWIEWRMAISGKEILVWRGNVSYVETRRSTVAITDEQHRQWINKQQAELVQVFSQQWWNDSELITGRCLVDDDTGDLTIDYLNSDAWIWCGGGSTVEHYRYHVTVINDVRWKVSKHKVGNITAHIRIDDLEFKRRWFPTGACTIGSTSDVANYISWLGQCYARYIGTVERQRSDPAYKRFPDGVPCSSSLLPETIRSALDLYTTVFIYKERCTALNKVNAPSWFDLSRLAILESIFHVNYSGNVSLECLPTSGHGKYDVSWYRNNTLVSIESNLGYQYDVNPLTGDLRLFNVSQSANFSCYVAGELSRTFHLVVIDQLLISKKKLISLMRLLGMLAICVVITYTALSSFCLDHLYSQMSSVSTA